MTQSTILAAGTTAANSTPVAVPSGATYTVGIFASSGTIPDGVTCSLLVDTPGADALLPQKLDANTPAVSITGPVSVIVARPATSVAIGAFQEA
jgi:hypothetical protein